jgi:hypothetical protein
MLAKKPFLPIYSRPRVEHVKLTLIWPLLSMLQLSSAL